MEVALMGDRLVFRCVKDGIMFATIYYHNSATTGGVLAEADSLIDYIKSNGWTKETSRKDITKMLINFLRQHTWDGLNGGISGGKDSLEWKALEEFGFELNEDEGNVDRDCGILDVTSEGMKYALYSANSVQTIDFDEAIITNDCFVCFDTNDKEMVDELQEIFNGVQIDDIPELDREFPTEIAFDDIKDTIKWYGSLKFTQQIIGKYGNLVYANIC